MKPYVIQKINTAIEDSILSKLHRQPNRLGTSFLPHSQHRVFYRIGGGRYWKIFTNFQPQFILNGMPSVSSRENYLYLPTSVQRDVVISVLSSSLFYWYFILTTNCRDLNAVDLNEFPLALDRLDASDAERLAERCNRVMVNYRENSQMKEKTSSLTGDIRYQEFYPRLSKPILDEIDRILARHYGFTDEELDFIINYDIKYRMGDELEATDEDS